MLLEKTESARAAMQSRSPLLSVRERQILVMVNGKRTVAELKAMLGEGVEQELDSLRARALVQGPPKASAVVAPAAIAMPVQAPFAPVDASPPPEQVAVSAPPTRAVQRRSLASGRMYLTDMLLMMRRPHASAWASALQGCADTPQLVDTMAGACQFLLGLQERGMGPAVVAQLLATLPQEQATELEDLLGEAGAACTQPGALMAA